LCAADLHDTFLQDEQEFQKKFADRMQDISDALSNIATTQTSIDNMRARISAWMGSWQPLASGGNSGASMA
jgi:hypothetical protein